MITYQVSIEGQTIQLPPGIGEKDDDVKRAMAPFFPEVTNALLTRKEEGETVTITIVKRAGSKGLTYLVGAQGGKNPAIALLEEVQALPEVGIVEALEYEKRIDDALREGAKQQKAVQTARGRLEKASPQPAPAVVVGF